MSAAKVLFAALAALSLSACGAPLQGRAARGFVEVKDDPSYDFRAVAPEGVALAGRAVADPGAADVAFWERAVILRMREIDGYALLGAADVRAPDGSAGRELSFGHDEDGKPYLYRVRLLVVKGKLVVIETGGHRAEVEKLAPSIAWMMGQLRVR
jgi:hypothetical protein